MLLTLSSPQFEGQKVKIAQGRLAHNVFGKDFKPGPADGVFGEATARACIRAKFWLGYPKRKQLGSYGDELDGYLSGTGLPLAHRLRAKRRENQAPKIAIRLVALAEARRQEQLKVKEHPAGSNKNVFGVWYGANGVPWCAEFVSFCYSRAKSESFKAGKFYAYVPFIVHDARAGANGLAVTQDPQPGDLCCFDWDGDGVADHVGLFVKWETKNEFDSIEGNTSLGNDSNGGSVMKRVRQRKQVQAFIHVAR